MKFADTTAAACRYGENARLVWSDWDVLWEDSDNDYQGHASFLAKKDGRFVYYEWHYGSCSGCDTWEAEDRSGEQIQEEMRKTAAEFKDEEHLKSWLDMLEGRAPISNHRDGGIAGKLDLLSGGLRGRIDGVRHVLGMPPLAEVSP